LTSGSIIRDSSTIINCDGRYRYNKIKNTNYSIVSVNNDYRLNKGLIYKKINQITSKYEISLNHDDVLIHGVNYLDQMANMFKITETNGSRYAKNKEFESFLKFKEPIIEIKLQLEKFLKKSLLISGVTILLISIFAVTFFILKCYCAKIRQKKKIDKLKKNIEMEILNKAFNDKNAQLREEDTIQEDINEIKMGPNIKLNKEIYSEIKENKQFKKAQLNLNSNSFESLNSITKTLLQN